MVRHLELSSDQWNERAMAEAVRRLHAGQPMARDFRVAVAAAQHLEQDCLRQVSLLLREDKLWSGLPESSLTVSQRCLIYRMLSRTGCCVEELLISEHRRFPIAVFRLLATPDLATARELLGTPECVRDSWGHGFLEAYPDPLCNEAMAVLVCVASMLKLDIAEIECRHAAIRRHLSTRIHTHVMGFGELSGMWMAQQARTRAAVVEHGAIGLKLRPRKTARPATASANLKRPRPGPLKKKKASRAGGAHRAFFSEQLRVRRLRMQAPGVCRMLWAAYKALSDEQRAVYAERGAAATVQGRVRDPKKNAFGLLRRKSGAVARAKHAQRRAFWQRLKGKPEAEQLDLLVDAALPAGSTGGDYLEALGRARALAKHGHDAARTHLQELQQELTQWQQAQGGDDAMELLQTLGIPQDRAANIAQHMRAEPAGHCTVFHFSPNLAGVATELTGALHQTTDFSKVRQAMEEERLLVRLSWFKIVLSRF